jgi:hypothetical protein
MKRVAIYLDEQEYRQLKAKLALFNIPVSKWMREVIKKFVGNYAPTN